MKEYKYTFKNGAVVIARTVDEACKAVERDYGAAIPVVKREKVK